MKRKNNMHIYILHWLDGSVEKIKANSISDAFMKAGYGAGALRALDWYEEVKEYMEFHRGDIVVVTVKHPDGIKTVTKGDMGIITEKKKTNLGIDYTVHTWSSDYVYGVDQLRLATQEEKNTKLIDLMMK